MLYKLQHPLVRDMVKESFYIRIEHPTDFLLR